MATPKNELTPMKRQYNALKEKNGDCILFFRLGDFYEMFDEDAEIASRELNLTLTTRDRSKPKEEQTPMCGVPYHSVDAYIARLVAKGYKIAICEQVEEPEKGKGLMEREITRIVTRGTVTESCMLDERKNNYFAALYADGGRIGLAFCDVSTGAFLTTVCADPAAAASELGRFAPVEVIRGGRDCRTLLLQDALFHRLSCCVDEADDSQFLVPINKQLLERHFRMSVGQMGLTGLPEAIAASGALLNTLLTLQKNPLLHVQKLECYTNKRYMELDLDARRNLELTETMRSHEKHGSLLGVLDYTRTPMGGRMLRSWLEKPLLDPVQIDRRQGAIEELLNNPAFQHQLEGTLKQIPDLERVLTRAVTGTVNGRELLGLSSGLRMLPILKQQLAVRNSPLLATLGESMDVLADCADRIEGTLVDEPPVTIREGNLIRAGFDPEVDRLRDIMNGGKQTILAIEAAEREKTGIRTLKVSYNRVFGYYIEISKSFVEQVPEHYIRKQTLANNERYITPELKALEDQVINAKDRLSALEYQLFDQLRGYISQQISRFQSTAAAVATADTLYSLSMIAMYRDYCRPTITLDNVISITDGRHPVVEMTNSKTPFVPNDTLLGTQDNQVSIITGPNMAGKSTYMRQVALIVLLAQIGSFVPARSATIGIVDRIFTRIGASDDLYAGQSTFMVEMTEVANILKHATPKSLLILDEIGRGTSTYDGMAIARAVLEHAANPKKLGAKTLFATHYHELSAIELELPNVKNYSVAVKKRGEKMVFLRKIVPGATDDSYGVEVAKLAGLPGSIITRARKILEQLELENPKKPVAVPTAQAREQITLEDMNNQQLVQALRQLSLDTLTPIEAMNELYRLKKMLD